MLGKYCMYLGAPGIYPGQNQPIGSWRATKAVLNLTSKPSCLTLTPRLNTVMKMSRVQQGVSIAQPAEMVENIGFIQNSEAASNGVSLSGLIGKIYS